MKNGEKGVGFADYLEVAMLVIPWTCQCFSGSYVFVNENRFFHRTFRFFPDRCFLCSHRLKHEYLSRGLSGKAP